MPLYGQVVADNALSFKNKIINGDMQVAQRVSFPDTQPSVTLPGYYTVDRWLNVFTSAGTWTLSQSNTAPPGFARSLKLDNTTSDASLGATDEIILTQRIEGINLQDFEYGTASAKPVTLSFWVRSNKTGTYTVEFDQYGDRQISRTYTIDSANTWEYKTLTVPGDVSGSIDNDNSAEYQILFWLGAGSNLKSGTLNTSGWASVTNANRVSSSQVNLADSTSNEWFITGVQLEVGSVATPFERRPYETEFRLCQRYFQKYTSDGTNYGPAIGYGLYNSATEVISTFQFPVQMRATATFSYSALSNFDLEPFDAEPTALATFSHSGTQFHSVTATDPSSRTQGFGALICCDVNGGWFAFSAEL